jgi:serpin B
VILYLINAISFKDAWRNEFEERSTRDMTFHAKTERHSFTIPQSDKSLQVPAQNGASYLYLPYKNERYAMTAILPDEGGDVYTFLDTQKRAGFSSSLFAYLQQAEYENITLSFPKFESNYAEAWSMNFSVWE